MADSIGGKRAVFGSIIHSVSFGEIEIIENGAVIFDSATGVILQIFHGTYDEFLLSKLVPIESIMDCREKLIIPGFVDAHCHAPQYMFSGTGMDLPLLQWLEKYTFPCESKFADDDFARRGFEKSISRHLKCGSTFCSYFGTLHRSACEILADVVSVVGQRAFIGKVSMDRNSPEYYIEETSSGCAEAELFIRHVLEQSHVGKKFISEIDGIGIPPSPVSVQGLAADSPSLLNRIDTPLVLPVVTPRFVPTCTEEIMLFLGSLSTKYGLPVQSHMSESVNEIAWVKSLHPEHGTYAEVYEHCNLLHPRAYMAHCCHCPEEEMAVLKRTGAGVVHCASSNFMLSSGVMDVRKFVDAGIPVALGTDVAGGYSPSMLDAIRQTLIGSQCKTFQHRESHSSTYLPLNYKEAFHLATIGGAEVLNMGNIVGNFMPGKKFDALVVDCRVEGGPFDLFESEGVSEAFQKFLFLGDDRNIETVFVDGRKALEKVYLKSAFSSCQGLSSC